ncbi:glycerophosphoryl diester phosphodiesterase [Fistulifera solaris]|uniref:glycerophosphodiester phosphodiesterase n=1 Tax=Fistulifera solaris TaxID=1519565 RepID=A0A1Z5K3Y8_FISSO|nr:glycerophosphoryl diester phosphodiesterase [Fistulifera solaris]|eukprot:GAX20791.1 glycerophosphoryl diester phosphodiesterase [Fistulifera solaris]
MTINVYLLLLLILSQVRYCLAATAEESSSSSSATCLPHSLRVPSTVIHRPHQLVIAHRGASYHLPEHTTAAYRLALELGADWIETDVVASSDGVLYCLHSVDLAVTSNVEEIFPDQIWYSPTFNRTGYWIFNFTADQIDKLTVQQRLSESRSTAFDRTMYIPRLEDALRVLKDWNIDDLLQRLPPHVEDNNTTTTSARKPSSIDLARSGMYLEFKDYILQKEEAGIDLVDLLYDHMEQYADLWKPLLEDQCYTVMRFDEYVVPGLVLQSFDVDALSRFHERWPLYFSDKMNESNSSLRIAPEPPHVLLLNYHGCTGELAEEFWFHIGDSWRSFLSGIGCDKQCLFDNDEFGHKAESFKLVLHPWTERPEQTFLVDPKRFPTVLEETRHLLCNVPAVHGIFSESVSIALAVAQLGCQDSELIGGKGDPMSDTTKESSTCYGSSQQSAIYTGLLSFALGTIMAVLISSCVHRRKMSRHYTDRTTLTSSDDEDCGNDAELT